MRSRIVIMLITLLVLLLWLLFVRSQLSRSPLGNGYHTGWPPESVPVMLWWIEDNGTLNGTSAISTSYAGVIQFSLTGDPVPLTQLFDWDYWSSLDRKLVERKDM